MDPIAFRSRECWDLCLVRRAEAAMDAPRLYPISVFLLERRDKNGICELLCHPQSQVGCEVDCEYPNRASCGCSCLAEHDGTLFSHALSPFYEILNERSKVWIHHTDRLERWPCCHWSRLAPDILVQGQSEVLLALGCLLHHHCSIHTASRGSPRKSGDHVK
jgi:hypothetical protein